MPVSTPMAFMGIDVGTTHTKGALVDPGGRVLAHSSIRHSVLSPRPGAAEHDMANAWWGDAVKVIRRLLAESSVPAESVAGIFVSGMCPSLGLTDDAGVPLRNGITQSDIRAPRETLRDLGLIPWDHLGRCTDILAPLLWVRENEPDCYAQVRKLFFAHSYVLYRLSGAYCTDINTVCWLTPLFDPKSARWNRAAADVIGLNRCSLPEICLPTQAVGTITQDAAEATGLSRHTQVLMGSTDTYGSLMAAGARFAGDAILYYGSVGIWMCCAEPVTVFLERPALCGMRGDPLLLGPILPMSGVLLEWFRDHFAVHRVSEGTGASKSSFAQLDEEASRLPPGSQKLIALPHFYGERCPTANPKARGVLFGLSVYHDVPHVYRALLEAFGYAIRHGLEHLEAAGEVIPARRLFASGGGARSLVWRQILSDILGLAQTFNAKGDEVLAGAYLAGMGTGYFGDVSAFYEEWLGEEETTDPDPAAHAVYDQLYDVYKQVYTSLLDTYGRLDAIQASSGLGPASL